MEDYKALLNFHKQCTLDETVTSARKFLPVFRVACAQQPLWILNTAHDLAWCCVGI